MADNDLITHIINIIKTKGETSPLLIGIETSIKDALSRCEKDLRLLTTPNENEAIEGLLKGTCGQLPKTSLTLLQVPGYLAYEKALILIGTIRNTSNSAVCLIDTDGKIPFSGLIGLGFTRLMPGLFTYDIENYNPARKWNNAEHWANPQLFGKHWW